jgi:hypothetical protein
MLGATAARPHLQENRKRAPAAFPVRSANAQPPARGGRISTARELRLIGRAGGRGFPESLEVWESEGACRRFGEVLGPHLQEAGISDQPEIYPTHAFVSARRFGGRALDWR